MATAEGERVQALLAVLKHPTRRRILQLLVASSYDAGVSPSEMAATLGEPLGDVGYHVKILVARGAVRLVGTADRAASVQHFYASTGLVSHPLARAALRPLGGHSGGEAARQREEGPTSPFVRQGPEP